LPAPLHGDQLALEALTSPGPDFGGDGEVALATSEAQTEAEATFRQAVQGGRLLGQDPLLVIREAEDGGQQPDPFGDRGHEGEGQHGIVGREGEALPEADAVEWPRFHPVHERQQLVPSQGLHG
jgi:hypothetical protein